MHLCTRKIPFYALVFTLLSEVDLIWTRAIRPIIAQSVQIHANFFPIKGSTVLIKIMK